ncbi:MAG: DUF6077 domain-containing protein [Holophagae bacterium]
MTGQPKNPTPDRRPSADPDRLTDACCLVFAVWTVLCHAVVFVGGSLDVLLLVTAGSAVAAGLAWLAWGSSRRSTLQSRASPPPPPAPRSAFPVPTAWWPGAAATLGGAVWIAAVAGAPWMIVWALSAAVLAAAALPLVLLTPTAEPPKTPRRRLGIWLLAVACALLTLVAHRPDIDDSLYVCLGQGAADHPSAALLAHDHMHGIDGLRLLLPTYRAHSIELLAGGLARITGVPAIVWLHLVFAPLAAMVAVFAIGRVAALVAPRRWLAVTGATIAVLVIVGNAHAWYGNLAFVRLHQGKGILATAVVPLLIAYGIEFARRPGRWRWLRLTAAQIAAIGTTATAMWVAPLVAMLAVVGSVRLDRSGLRTLVLAAATTLYAVVLAVGFWFTMQSPDVVPEQAARIAASASADDTELHDEFDEPRSVVPDELLERSATYVLGDRRLRLAVLGLLVWGWWLSPEPTVRRLHLVFASFTGLILVNPWLVDSIATSVTGRFTFWRIAWVVPVPLLAGLVLTAPLARVAGRRGAALSFAVTAAVLVAVTTQPVMSTGNGVRLGTPGLKVDEGWEVARALVERVPPGALVVAPPEVAPWIATFPHHPAPVIVRRQYLPLLTSALDSKEIRLRLHAELATRDPGRRPRADRHLLELVDREPVAGVVVAAPSAELHDLERGLIERGFTAVWSPSGYRIWVRRAVQTSSED